MNAFTILIVIALILAVVAVVRQQSPFVAVAIILICAALMALKDPPLRW